MTCWDELSVRGSTRLSFLTQEGFENGLVSFLGEIIPRLVAAAIAII
jgi:hypothetical protein